MIQLLTVAITGHRPNKLGGDYDLVQPKTLAIKARIIDVLKEVGAEYLITGMALGIDTLFANIAIELRLPFTAAIPFRGQESMWPSKSQRKYDEILSKATEIVYISGGGYSPHKMQVRNEWMVDNSRILISVWDGTSGGTANCVRYADSKGVRSINIDPKEF